MRVSPEVARMIAEFEDDNTSSHQKDSSHHHHEQHPGVQATFIKDVRSLSAVVEEMGSPFLEESDDLLVLYTRDIMNVAVCETGGMMKYLVNNSTTGLSKKDITEPLHKNKLQLFSRQN